MADVTDRQKFDLAVKATVQFEFGSICDVIDTHVKAGQIEFELGESIKSKIRKHGNRAINVIANHLDHYKVSRNHAKDQINPARVIARVTKESG